MKQIDIPKTIQKIADQKAQTAFTKDNLQERQEEGLGIALAGWADWNGLKIMRVFKAALEDANYSECANEIDSWIKKLNEI